MPTGVYKHKKGHKLPPRTQETKDKISKTSEGKHYSPKTEFKKGLIPWNKDKKCPDISKRQKGKRNHRWGKKSSEKTKEKQRQAKLGAKSHFWKGGITTPKRLLFLSQRRRARKQNAEGSHTLGEWELLKKQYGFKCPCCNRKEPEIKLTEDHIIPLDKKGSDYIENIQPLCGSCNCKKYTKIIKYEQL